jgi:hypothetical protein
MTCKDCKYYNGTFQTNFSEYIKCVKPNYKGIDAWKWVSSKLKKCKDFEPKESKDELR